MNFAQRAISFKYHKLSKCCKPNFENSDFIKKNSSILLIFYLYQVGYDILDFIIKLVDEWSFPSTDLEIIKKDWETITKKIAEGKAHELSEGDTYYLGACTKGANALSVRKQPFSDIPAKQRAYSFKQGYVNHIIASIANEPTEIYGKLIQSVAVAKKQTIEEIVISKFKPYYGKSEEEILKILDLKLNKKAKSFYANLTKAILGISLEKEIEEFEKAEIKVKTVRLKENNFIKILHLDSNHPLLWEQLEALGFENHQDFTSSKEEVEAKIHDYQGIVIRSRFKIDKTFLDKATHLQFIARVGAGLESIDCEYAASKNIHLIAAPEGNRNAVGEHALGMLLSLMNKLNQANQSVKKRQLDS
jgi:hypothetical protein